MIKWIFISVGFLSLPILAAKQYSKAECVLVKHQVADYKRRLGLNSPLYIRAENSFSNHCQKPTQSRVIKTVNSLPPKKKQHINKVSITPTPQVPVKHTVNQPKVTNYLNVASLLKPLLPIFIFFVVAFIAIVYLKKKMPSIKGHLGEKHVIKGLEKHLTTLEYSIVNDVTLPLEDGGTTQVDHIIVSRFGIFVIETKNMSGWIFGNEKQAKWTQTIHRSKHQFQNPIRQNYKHTKTLSELLDIPHELFHSVVVFTANAELKTKMPVNVGYLNDMVNYIKSFSQEIIDHQLSVQTLRLIDTIKLKQGRKTNKQHVGYLKEKNQ